MIKLFTALAHNVSVIESNNLWSNPFTLSTPQLVNISTGHRTDEEVKIQLTTVTEISDKALEQYITTQENKKKVVKLNTFHTQNKKSKSST
jgi:hypothetical protein